MNRSRLNYLISLTFESLVLILALFTPLLFWNLTSESYETPKILLLALSTGVLLILWAIRLVVEGRATITKTPLDLPWILLIVVFIISTFFATSRSVAIFGAFPKINGSVTSFMIYALFYFALVSNLRSQTSVRRIFWVLSAVGILLSALSLLSYFGVQILPSVSALNFTPTGSSFSTTSFLGLLIPFLLLAILRNNQEDIESYGQTLMGVSPTGNRLTTSLNQISVKLALSLLLTLFAAAVVLTGVLATQFGMLVALLLALAITPRQLLKKNVGFLMLPVIIAAAVAILSFLPGSAPQNPLSQRAQNFPREIQMSPVTSWKISVSAFRDSPIWGTGPGSYLTNFTFYKPLSLNTTNLWNMRFDSAFNEYLQFLGTLGGLGLLGLLLITITTVTFALKSLAKDQSNLQASLSISAIVFFVLLALHTSTATLWVIGILILAGFMVTHRELTESLVIRVAAMRPSSDGGFSRKFDVLPLLLFLIVFISIITFFYHGGISALADYHHKQAINAVANKNALETYNQLVRAEKLNPHIDTYRSDLAQTNFALANAIATNKGPTEASPTGSLTETDKQNIKQLLSQAINEGRTAVALNPNNSANWEILGGLYKQISGVTADALTYSLDAYGHSIQRDPLNPQLRLIVGGIYYSAKNYEMAARFFGDSVNLKSDFANGYYNLAIALREKGDLKNSQLAAEKVMSIVNPKSKDYEIAANFLTELKSSDNVAGVATSSATLNQPNNQSGSTLSKEGLPKVLELPKKTDVTTPEAVKKP